MMVGRRRRGVEWTTAAVILFFLLILVSFAYLGYQVFTKPRASIVINFSPGCSSVVYTVSNDDSRILHGWSVVLTVSPSGSGITMTPGASSVQPLAPGGNATSSFTMNYSGAPRGNYQVVANLVNDTQSIAVSPSITCTVR